MNVVIGGGPAGFFAAITARRLDPATPVLLLEAGRDVLRKVSVSGGGRCNVTHACYDPRELVTNYPRGARELRGPFSKFGPAEVMDWFAAEGVELKTEDDGRVFPVTDDARTIVEALVRAARQAGVEVRIGARVADVRQVEAGFECVMADGAPVAARRVVLATGGSPGGHALAAGLGHTIEPAVPSLFTFRCEAEILDGLAGVAAPVRLEAAGVTADGPLLITHTGISGPAVLRLSAWGARVLHDSGHRFDLKVQWLTGAEDLLQDQVRRHGKRQISSDNPTLLPKRLWAALVRKAGLADDARWADLNRAGRLALVTALENTVLPVRGQSPFKDEFVTCGGVALGEIDFRTMESRVCPGLHVAGEALDVDAITGGFNFQGCWTTGWLAGQEMGSA